MALCSTARPAVASTSNRQPLRIIPIVTEFSQLEGAGQNIQAIRRPLELSDDSEFVWQLGRAFESIAMEMGLAQEQEPRRLLEAKEYRAAVISAMTLLETHLRQRLNKAPREAVRRPMSMRQLLDLAQEQGYMDLNYGNLSEWTKIRNEAVHGGRLVSRSEAKVVVEGVESIVRLT